MFSGTTVLESHGQRIIRQREQDRKAGILWESSGRDGESAQGLTRISTSPGSAAQEVSETSVLGVVCGEDRSGIINDRCWK